MAQAKIRKNDMVLIIAGKDKGKFAAVLSTNQKEQTVVLKGVNIKTKHHKPSQENNDGKIEKKEYPIHISNVAYLVKKGAQGQKSIGSKIGWKVDPKTNKKQRVMKKINKTI
ncbi:50S ribosomal protein L24 [Metamycoplasma hominis]|uniref:Large ribosomal subunit protein uL24 n=1 Tax=Metamycoplasma hominis TaxID=2098 RepID=A0A454CAH0_METHO|nr:50S ribosomal protein L24 [Metamycoplasma hominis]AIU34055.1 50S ribosomal protein L24 [Metamycoplasma hominis ATCC 27545]AKJ52567.1 50S ribosomal protein L24 [Metamycoplasma hominis]AYK04671.1 50S ribosomal protein L24 [Metamycoplasma hominis]AYN65429.1 50S ribosomal protein L24 [Metamycoplasma hominis]KGF61090.1 50S ribosomal protein L24 [Metamycoplasma hominis]